MRTRAWFRPTHRPSPETVFITLVIVLGAIAYAWAATARPAAPHSITDIAPRCADARPPCRVKGGLS